MHTTYMHIKICTYVHPVLVELPAKEHIVHYVLFRCEALLALGKKPVPNSPISVEVMEKMKLLSQERAAVKEGWEKSNKLLKECTVLIYRYMAVDMYIHTVHTYVYIVLALQTSISACNYLIIYFYMYLCVNILMYCLKLISYAHIHLHLHANCVILVYIKWFSDYFKLSG